MVSLPFSEHCEPLVNSPEELDFLLNCLQAEMQHEDWKYLEIRPAANSWREEGGFTPAGSFCYHWLDLRPDLGEIFRGLHKDSVQRRIRRAERSGLVCHCGRSDKLLKDFYKVQLPTRRRHHLPPQPFAWFQSLIASMGNSLEVRVAYQQSVPIAAILTLRFRDVVYYKYNCSDLKFKNLGATSLLLWEAIKSSKMAGAQKFDLGRSQLENKGLISFKEHWTKHSSRISYWRYPASGFALEVEQWKLGLAKRIFACMPGRLLALTGRLVYRHIG